MDNNETDKLQSKVDNINMSVTDLYVRYSNTNDRVDRLKDEVFDVRSNQDRRLLIEVSILIITVLGSVIVNLIM